MVPLEIQRDLCCHPTRFGNFKKRAPGREKDEIFVMEGRILFRGFFHSFRVFHSYSNIAPVKHKLVSSIVIKVYLRRFYPISHPSKYINNSTCKQDTKLVNFSHFCIGQSTIFLLFNESILINSEAKKKMLLERGYCFVIKLYNGTLHFKPTVSILCLPVSCWIVVKGIRSVDVNSSTSSLALWQMFTDFCPQLMNPGQHTFYLRLKNCSM